MRPPAGAEDTFAGIKPQPMKRIVTVFGLIAGAIVSTLMMISIPLMHRQKAFGSFGMLVGYASMLLAFCFIFIAVKSYRDKHLGGIISMKQAFLTGMWVAVIASVCYTVTWVIMYKNFYPGFLDDMMRSELDGMRRSSRTAAQISARTAELESMKAMYNTWPGLIGMTLMEILPLGLLVALISAFILKRKRAPLPDMAGLSAVRS
jgi:hypothetical protein